MNELEDIKLKALLQRVKLDSPEPDFSLRVMNKIFEESNVLEKIKSERVLGKGFWIITTLFISLLVAVFVMQFGTSGTESQLQGLLPETSNTLSEGYNSFFNKLSAAPMAIGAILAAFSVLLFLDRFISSNTKIFA